MSRRLLCTRQAAKDARKLAAGLKRQAEELLAVVGAAPHRSSPPLE